jgi:hypothetical protein
MAAFQVSIHGRFWVSTEVLPSSETDLDESLEILADYLAIRN